MRNEPISPPLSILPPRAKKLKLLDIDPLELARQLTLMEFKLFSQIRMPQFLNRTREGGVGDKVDHVKATIATSNKVS